MNCASIHSILDLQFFKATVNVALLFYVAKIINEHVYFGLRPIALYKNNKIYTVHSDYLGTPREIKDGSTTVWKWENKDIFGSNLPTVSTIEYNLRFSGQYFDKETKLHYNINRTYNPQLGRYMQSDPKGLAAGFNTYNYVKNNPLNAVDPTGLSSQDVIKIINGFRKSVDGMVERGERRPSDSWLPNNGFPLFSDKKFKICVEQSGQLISDLYQMQFDDNWRIQSQSGKGHFWTVAISSNEKDPIIYMDPWKDDIGVGYRCKKGCHGSEGYIREEEIYWENKAKNKIDKNGWYDGWDITRPLSKEEMRKKANIR